MSCNTILIGIAGGTGSGKTSVAKALARDFKNGETVILEQDWYYRNLPRSEPDFVKNWNFDHPDAIEFEGLAAALKELKLGQTIQAPQYDYTSHSRKEESLSIQPHRVVIVEGILILWEPRVRDLLDIRIFVDTDADIRFIRRLTRDIEDRGRSLQNVIEQYYKTVRPSHETFVEPSKRYADVIIPEGSSNKVAIDLLRTKITTLLK
ncbi:MAG TPA: uridine kinase [Candidatus Marinimicrobia bacterium]|nr:uridine kinase [Candidatus Neomarinimicrobiota bacterium]